jgi:hypothetical protein
MYVAFLKSRISYRAYINAILDQICKQAWWQHHQAKLTMGLVSQYV